MKKSNLIYSILIVLMSIIASSQNFEGRVIDDEGSAYYRSKRIF